MTLKLVLDRFEGDVAVCLDDDSNKYHISSAILDDICEGDIFKVEFDGESFSCPVALKDETEQKKSDISKRMKKLFSMNHRRPPKL